ncbi:uncharacterized protein LTR77_001806 [Saxophila tyrrhenica]|uniref:Uncharacterized protein n=1 Tax=Saxophila tyrrhenica TaxID=1690608 RepID=A0AAV9PR08_9PEZI|nr:hypothetical protein LTR77_001806 [Saxophila tyrrhenica]
MSTDDLTSAVADLQLTETPAGEPEAPQPPVGEESPELLAESSFPEWSWPATPLGLLDKFSGEVRNQIYGHLLDGNLVRNAFYKAENGETKAVEYYKDYRLSNLAHGIKFRTNIMLTSKAVYAEAKAVLLKRNDFVIFSWQWDPFLHSGEVPFMALLIEHNVPTISSATDNFDYESMRLHFRHREWPQNESRAHNAESLIMLACDLGHLFQVISCYAVNRLMAGTVMLKDAHNGTLKSFTGPSDELDKAHELTIELRQLPNKRDVYAEAARMLYQLQHPVCPALRLT